MEQENKLTETLSHDSKLKTYILRFLPIILIIGLSLFIRVYMPWGVSVRDGFVRIAADDAPYHLRLIENTVHNFPQRIYYDPFVFFKDYTISYVGPLFTWLGSSFAFLLQFLFFGGGTPTRYTIELASSLLPAFGGTIIVYLGYLTSLLLFQNRKTALLSALILATMPGQFLGRTLFGFADHHFLETLFSLLAFYFLMLALREIENFDVSDSADNQSHFKLITLYSLSGGIALTLYLLSWVGAAFLLPMLLVFLFIIFIMRHLQSKSTSPLFISIFFFLIPPFLVSLLLLRLNGLEQFFYGTLILPLSFTMLFILIMNFLSKLLNSLQLNKFLYPLIFVFLFVLGLGMLNLPLINSLFQAPLNSMLNLLFPTGQLATVAEVQPMFFVNGLLSLDSAWANFTTNLYLAFISLIALTFITLKKKNSLLIFLVIWSLYMLMATNAQNRFAYYLAVNIALLSGFAGIHIFQWILNQMNKYVESGSSVFGVFKSAKIIKVLLWIWLLVVLIYPNSLISTYSASRGLGTHPDWYDSLSWLSNNTPSPGLSYHGTYQLPEKGEDYIYPPGSYSVMSWWDFGYMIAYYGLRMPVANPGGFGVGSYSNVMFLDLNKDGQFQKEEPLIVDINEDGFFGSSDILLSGTKPSDNQKLTNFTTDYMYYDYHQDKMFNPLEPIIYDKDKNFTFSEGDELLYGALTPSLGSKLRFISLNPGVAPFFVATDVKTAQDLLKYYNTRYIITSLSMATSRFWAMAQLGAGSRSKFIGDFLMETVTEGGVEIKPITIYYPEYYKTIIARLHFFKGEEVIPYNSTWVIAYEIKNEDNKTYKIITNEWLFKTYYEAVEFIKKQEGTNYLIVGKSPNISPVPLEKLENFKAVYETINTVLKFRHDDRKLRGIIIFEYLGLK